jgi:hypothetical protein
VLFYVYPLKFLATGLLGPMIERHARGLDDGRFVMVVYSAGVVAIFSIFVLLYAHAWRGRRALELTAELGSGQCGLSDGSSPGEWRLPTQAELEALLDLRFSNPSISNAQGDAQWTQGDAFVGVESRFYWSSDLVDDCVGPLPGAIAVHLGDGTAQCRAIALSFTPFWPVRATP